MQNVMLNLSQDTQAQEIIAQESLLRQIFLFRLLFLSLLGFCFRGRNLLLGGGRYPPSAPNFLGPFYAVLRKMQYKDQTSWQTYWRC